jgi:ATP-dependent helicase/nuclease subunit A
VIAAKRRAVTLAEEMRILYVAMTRAKDRLIVTASQKRTDCGKVLTQGLLLSEPAVPAWLLQRARSSLEWLLYSLADQRALHEAFETHLTPTMDDRALFELHVHRGDEMRQLTQRVRQLRDRKRGTGATPKTKARPDAASRQLLAELKERLDWRYGFGAAVREPAKRSVSELTHHDDEFARLDYSRALDRRPLALVASDMASTRPDSARQVGTATHLVISSLDLRQAVTRQAIERTCERLVEEQAIVPDVADKVDVDAILAFFESDLGAVVLDGDNTVHREWPFTWGLHVGEVADADEIVVVQGIIDMLVQTPEGLVVIDFKSDRVSGEQIARRAEAYRGQLDLYGRAAGDILGTPVRQKWLYFLAPRASVAVEA